MKKYEAIVLALLIIISVVLIILTGLQQEEEKTLDMAYGCYQACHTLQNKTMEDQCTTFCDNEFKWKQNTKKEEINNGET